MKPISRVSIYLRAGWGRMFLGWIGTLLLCSACTAQGGGDFASSVRNYRHPHLTVVISIDQFRADYLRRFTDLFLPAMQGSRVGGFRYLMTAGSYFQDARYTHFPLFTGPGHAAILTGGSPYKTGIISNTWWNKATFRPVYCVDDPSMKVVGAGAKSKATPMGPLNLRSTTVGDELKLATGNAAKVISLSLKDRAAILLGGHLTNACIWFDDSDGHWISSTAFCKEGRLPSWVESLNTEAIPSKTLGTEWRASFGSDPLARTLLPNLPPQREPYGMGLTFPHRVGSYTAFTHTPAANAFVFESAKRAIQAEKLGQRGDLPDLLAINLATNDYVGHAFGPYSPEALDVTLQTDRQLSEFLNFIRTTIPGGLKEVVVVVTADHGVAPIPENAQSLGLSAGRIKDSDIDAVVQKALSTEFGEDEWVGKGADGKKKGGYTEPYLYLNELAIERALTGRKADSRAKIEEVAAEAIQSLQGIYVCYTRSQLLSGQLPHTEITSRVVNGFHPKLSGDVVVVTDQLYFTDAGDPKPSATTHGSPYAYDTHVPILIAGFSIRVGVWTDPVSPIDIAPTLCALLGIELPSSCDGVILKQALQPNDSR